MKTSPWLVLAALLALVFTLATSLASRVAAWSSRGGKSNSFVSMMFGDSRELFANQLFTQADVYFHSGYYPSIFDQNAAEQKEIIAASHGKKESEEEEKKEDFIGRSRDWIDAFGRNFRLTRHVHLEGGDEREILPWLRLAADLNPNKIEVYTVGAYFLFDHLKRPEQAEAFLREGLRNNPDSCEILFSLGRVYYLGDHDVSRARNVWQFGIQKYLRWPEAARKKNELIYEELAGNLARLETAAGRYQTAVGWLEAVQKVSPAPEAIQKQIDALREKLAAPVPVTPGKIY